MKNKLAKTFDIKLLIVVKAERLSQRAYEIRMENTMARAVLVVSKFGDYDADG